MLSHQFAPISSRLPKLPESASARCPGDDFFGFSKISVRHVLERLPDAAGCATYNFAAVPRAAAHLPAVNVSGCARTEPWSPKSRRKNEPRKTARAHSPSTSSSPLPLLPSSSSSSSSPPLPLSFLASHRTGGLESKRPLTGSPDRGTRVVAGPLKDMQVWTRIAVHARSVPLPFDTRCATVIRHTNMTNAHMCRYPLWHNINC
jgi:hypothetical protein